MTREEAGKEYRIFEQFNKQWALVTAGSPARFNTCTVSWGSLGTLWGRSVATVYINPDRYTWAFLKDSDVFTVSWFPPAYRQALAYLGEKSGRDEDKIAAVGLTPKQLGDGITFAQANLTLVCRKLYQGEFHREGLAETIHHGIYENWRPHWMFVGEILEVEDLR